MKSKMVLFCQQEWFQCRQIKFIKFISELLLSDINSLISGSKNFFFFFAYFIFFSFMSLFPLHQILTSCAIAFKKNPSLMWIEWEKYFFSSRQVACAIDRTKCCHTKSILSRDSKYKRFILKQRQYFLLSCLIKKQASFDVIINWFMSSFNFSIRKLYKWQK